MQLVILSWHDYLLLISSIGCLAGICLIFSAKQTKTDELAQTDRSLFMMIFSYWMVYCASAIVQKMLVLSEWETLLTSLQLTAAISYFLTVCCILALPLYRLSVQEVE